MNNKIKTIICIILLIIAFTMITVDYINFDLKESYSNLVFGNTMVPDRVVISHLKDRKINDQNIFSSMIADIKIINISNNKNVVIVRESLPRFYDDQNIYLASGVKVQYKDYSNYSLLLSQITVPKFTSDSSMDISANILELINLLSDSNNPIIKNLNSITLSEDNVLSMKSGNCKIVLMDNLSKQNKKEISNKIIVLNKFMSEAGEDINNISHIDLRWSDRVFITTI